MTNLTNTAGQHKDEVDGVGIIVADSIDTDQVTKVLLMERGLEVRYSGQFENPGGSLEPGETPEQAVHRELLEELGVRPTELRQLYSYQPLPDQEKRDHIFIVALVDEPRICEPGKCSSLRWVPLEELPAVLLTKDATYDFRRLGWLAER